MMAILEPSTRIIFFTGKGGVGKTSVACATALTLAEAGKRVLLVSTDPASNLDEVLGTKLETHPTPISAVPNLHAMNLDPEKAAAAYRDRMVTPYRGLLPDAAIRSMEEQFSGSCTLEIAAFDEFSHLLGDRETTEQFDHVIFDTAPTGHTLRLLSLPSAWTGFIQQNSSGTSCLGPLAGLQAQKSLYEETVAALASADTTTMVLVARAEPSALREAARTSAELQQLGVHNQQLVINGIFNAQDQSDPFAVAMEQRSRHALQSMPEILQSLPRTEIPFRPSGVVGLAALRQLGMAETIDSNVTSQSGASSTGIAASSKIDLPPLGSLIDELARPGHGVILTMGKGGVGKTTVASAVAIALAERGFPVHLSTTDPAAHVAATVGGKSLPHLTVSRIDPVEETKKYTALVMEQSGSGLDASGKALLEEDLRSPCTEEIAVFRAFAEAVAEGVDHFVVLDTAPTGHTILLLDSALAYHREVMRQSSGMPESVQQLLPRLRDPKFTRILLIALPEATPVHEAAALQRDLQRAEIEPFAWVVNQVLSLLPVKDPGLKARQSYERTYIDEVRRLSTRAAFIPWTTKPPVGRDLLLELLDVETIRQNVPVS